MESRLICSTRAAGCTAVERRPAVIDPDLELRDPGLLLDLEVGEAGDRPHPLLSEAATRRKESRSSPKIFSAISARTPDNMWSRRCEIGWPTLTETGSTASRRRISATSSAFGRPPPLSATSRSEEWTPLGMLVELGPAGAPAHRGDLRISIRSRSAIDPTRLLSGSEMPGAKAMVTVNEPSLNGGRKAAAAARRRARLPPRGRRRCRRAGAGGGTPPGAPAALARLSAR